MYDVWLEIGLAVLADPAAAERRLRDGVQRAERLTAERFALDELPRLEARQKGGIDREMLHPRTGLQTTIASPSADGDAPAAPRQDRGAGVCPAAAPVA